jgi:ribonuclease G
MEEILINVESKETRCAHLRHGQLHDLVVERRRARQGAGNIYKGRVTNILHNIQSAFIDVGEGENGFIHISDILENTKKFEELFDMDFDLDFDLTKVQTGPTKEPDIEQVLKPDQSVLVQVVKEPIGNKGARLTSKISIPGRYLVLLPNTPHHGVSRKIEDRTSRERLKRLLRAFEMPQEMGLICRTASRLAPTEILIDEAQELLNAWEVIREGFNKAEGPTLLFEESDLVKRMVMMAVNRKFARLLIDDYATFQRCKQLYEKYAHEHPLRIELYRDKIPMFERFNVEREIDRALRHKIWLPGGAYLYFDRTEAMTTIDVNSGRSTATDGAANVEEALVQINLDAATEIARQLRLRNIGGLVICDFIDMRSRKNQRRVLDCLRDAMKEDSAKCTILGMSELGLVEMTRQRSREALAQTIFTACPYCSGTGTVKSHESIVVELERAIKKLTLVQQQFGLKLVIHPALDAYLEGGDRDSLCALADSLNAHLDFGLDDNLHINAYEFYSSITGDRIEV